jgi:spore germination cell wall hydrolase CwlJ-like protein
MANLRNITLVLISLLSLVVTAYADQINDDPEYEKEVRCLAQNIFYEAGSESEEGKVAVGLVTINRALDERFGRSICQVVHQRTKYLRMREVEKQQKKILEFTNLFVCQFSWVCHAVSRPRKNDPNWIDSQQVARNLLEGQYDDLREKYADAIYFHSVRIRPSWVRQKQKISRIGNHIFYSDKVGLDSNN